MSWEEDFFVAVVATEDNKTNKLRKIRNMSIFNLQKVVVW